MVEEQKWEQRVQLVDRGKDNVLEQGSGAEETDVNKFRKCFGGKLSRPCWQIGFWPWEKGRKQGWVLHLCFEPLGRCLAIYWDRKDQGILCIRERGKQMKTQYREWKKKKKRTCHMCKIKWRHCKIRRKLSKQEFSSVGGKIWCLIMRHIGV